MRGAILLSTTEIDKILQSGNLPRFYVGGWIWTKYIFSAPEGKGEEEVEYRLKRKKIVSR